MERTLHLFSIGLLILSCNNQSVLRTLEKKKTKDTTILNFEKDTSTISTPSQFRDLRDFPAIAKEENIDSLISGMIKEDCVYESAIGFAGAYTEIYACFERLCELSSDKEMFELVKHSNTNVRLYALKGLIAKESPYTSKAKLLLNTDEEMVCIFNGCSMLEQKMKDVYIVNNEE